jgi:hypothetical protein
MRSFRTVLTALSISLTSLCAANALAFSQALLDLQTQGLIDLSLPNLPPTAQTPCSDPGPGRDECIMTTPEGRQVVISSPPLVEGCVEGLVKLHGVWVCRAFLTSTAVAILTPPPAAGGGNSGSNGGPGPGGYLGADGQLHLSPSDSSPTCECGRVIGTTTDKDSKDAGEKAASDSTAPTTPTTPATTGSDSNDRNDTTDHESNDHDT